MRTEGGQAVRLIPVQVRKGEGRLLFATSPALPGLLVTATSDEELAAEVPACIRMLMKAEHGLEVEVFPVEPDEWSPPQPYVPWAALPAARECA